jgi:hypothetical protein
VMDIKTAHTLARLFRHFPGGGTGGGVVPVVCVQLGV